MFSRIVAKNNVRPGAERNFLACGAGASRFVVGCAPYTQVLHHPVRSERLRESPRKNIGRRRLAVSVGMTLEAVERRLLMATISGAVFNDYDADFIRDAGEPGISGFTVFVDQNTNGVFDGTSNQFTSSTPIGIPPDAPGASSGVTSSAIAVVGVGTVSQVRVEITSLTHTFDGDLILTLISPAGTRVTLSNRRGSSGDNYIGTVFDDDAEQSVTVAAAPFTGLVRPEAPLATFAGQSADGNWTLEINDTAPGDFGSLNAWAIAFASGEKSRVSSSTGDYTLPNLAAGTQVIRQINRVGFNPTGPAGGFHGVDVTASNAAISGIHFGNREPPGTVSGVVFGDYDSDGTRDPGEPGLAGWTVYVDTDNDGRLDAGEPSQITAGDGTYTFSLPPGNHRVREVLQTNWVQTAPGSGGVLQRNSAGAATPSGTAQSGQEISKTEILVRVNNRRGLRELDRYVRANPASAVARMIVPADSAQIFRISGDSLVEVRLKSGVDPLKAISVLNELALVDYAEPNPIATIDPREFTPNDPSFGSQFHHPLIQNPLAWDTTLGDARIKVGVTDDGFALSHPDLWMNIWINPGEIPLTRLANLTDINADGYLSMIELNDPLNIGPFKITDLNADARIDWLDITAPTGGAGTDDGTGGWSNGIDEANNGFADDIIGRDVWDGDNNPASGQASEDHGTHVAGIFGARTNNGVGVSGVAGGVTIVPIRFYGATGRQQTSVDFLNAYAYAANAGVKILNTSYQLEFLIGQQSFNDALSVMYGAGILHFNSAGNSGALNPARQQFDTTLYVANTQSNDVRNGGSNYGWGIDLAAPGTSIFSTSLGSSLTAYTYENKTGTSMAAPMAAGVAALIWSAHPTWTREQVAAALIGSAQDIDAIQSGAVKGLLGAGRVNAHGGVNLPIAPPTFKNTINTPLLPGLPAEGGLTDTLLSSFTLDVASVFDAATLTTGNFDLRSDGFDNTFGTADDAIIPFTLRFGDAAAPVHGYQVGTNRLFFTITGSMGAHTYRFTAKPAITDPFGQPLDGNNDGTGGDALTRTFAITGVSNPRYVSVGPGGAVTDITFGNREIVAPTAIGTFAFETRQLINYAFSEDVAPSIAAADLVLVNTTTSTTIPAAQLTVAYDAGGNVARFGYSGTPGGILPDGNYIATLPAAAVIDLYGNAQAADATANFFVLAADATRDRNVNLDDFTALAANFGASDRVFSQGDFNYDQSVNLDDFTILATQFGKTLPAPGDLPRGPAAATSAAMQPASLKGIDQPAFANPTKPFAFSTTRIIDDLL